METFRKSERGKSLVPFWGEDWAKMRMTTGQRERRGRSLALRKWRERTGTQQERE